MILLFLKAYSSVDISMNLFKVNFTMKLTFRVLLSDDDNIPRADAEMTESEHESAVGTRGKVQWDDDCPWSEWYSSEDPVKGENISRYQLSLPFEVCV